MAIEYVGGITGVGTGASYTISLNGTLTGGLANTPTTGDVIVVCAAHGNAGNGLPAVSGNNTGAYIAAFTAFHVNDTWDTEFGVFYRVCAPGSPLDTTLTITRTNTTTYGGATVVQVWRGVSGQNTLDVTPTTASAGNTCAADPPTITPVTVGSLVIACGAGTQAPAGSIFTAFTGFTNFLAAYQTATTSSISAAMASLIWTSGAVDPPIVSGGVPNNASSSWGAATVVLRPNFPVPPGSLMMLGMGV